MNSNEFTDSQIMRLNAPLPDAAQRPCQPSDEESADLNTAGADERMQHFELLCDELAELMASVNDDSSASEDPVPLQLDHVWDIPADEICCHLDWGAGSPEDDGGAESLDTVHLEKDDQLTRTVKQITGWSLLNPSNEGGAPSCLAFSDSEKKYTFTTWKICITFHRLPGIAFMDWSPETLETDLKRAMSVTLPENFDRRQLADTLAENLPLDQLREVVELLRKKCG